MPEFQPGTNITTSFTTNYWFGGSIGTAFLNEEIEKLEQTKEVLDKFLSDTKKAKALVNNYIDGVISSIDATAAMIDRLLGDMGSSGIYIRVAYGENTSMKKLLMRNTKGVPVNKSGFVSYMCVFFCASSYTELDYKMDKISGAMTDFPSFTRLY